MACLDYSVGALITSPPPPLTSTLITFKLLGIGPVGADTPHFYSFSSFSAYFLYKLKVLIRVLLVWFGGRFSQFLLTPT